MIEILSSGAPNTVQDLGRLGHLSRGVSRSGAMDGMALRTANALVDNEEGAAGLEIALFPFRLRFGADTTFALTGALCDARLDDEPLPPWWARSVRAGQTLVIDPPRTGARAYLAFAGGLDLPMVLGSRSTELKSGFGGLEGRGLRRGDALAVKAPVVDTPSLPHAGLGGLPHEPADLFAELAEGRVTVRAMPAAEHDAFTDAARASLAGEEWQVSGDANRMGMRLGGSALALKQPMELFSHGLLPGTVQVTPSGQPIVQLAEANTCGGYPKIATVIDADLWRLAQAFVGTRVRFAMVTLDVAIDARRAQADAQAALRRDLWLATGRA